MQGKPDQNVTPRRRGPDEVAKRPSSKEFDASKYPRNGTCGICCSMFWFLMIIPVAFFFYHAYPSTVLILVFIQAVIVISPWMLHAGGAVMSDMSGPCLTMSFIFSVTFAFLSGVRCHYVLLQPMRNLVGAREYTGVYPQQAAIAFPDAAYLKFAGDVVLDSHRAVSYQTLDSGTVTFCVAPITNSANAGRVEFWAYGVDCCGESGGKFECDDADDASARAGWVLQDSQDSLWTNLGLYISPPDSRRDVYVEAVKKAEAIYPLTTPGAESIFVRWTKKDKEDLIKLEWVFVAVMAIIIMLQLGCLSLCMTRLFQRFSYVRKYHRSAHKRGSHEDVDNTEEEDFAQRLDEFLVQALDEIQDEAAVGTSDLSGTVDRIANFDHSKFRQNLSLKDTLIMNVLLPYIVLMACVIMATYMRPACYQYNSYLIIVPFYCVLGLFIFAWTTTPHRTVTGLFILLVALNGSYVGHVNYRENMFHYCSVETRRSYEQVLAESSTDEYADAGKLQFEESARLRTDLGVGFLYQDATYCAAPVISDTAPCAEYSAEYTASQSGVATIVASGGVSSPAITSTSEDASTTASTTTSTIPQVSETTGNIYLQEDHVVKHLGHRRSPPPASRLRRREKSRAGLMAASDEREGGPVNFMQQTSHHHHHHHVSRQALTETSYNCTKPVPTKLEWWAIGKDCCDYSGNFWCDGADTEGAHAAVVVRAFPDMFAETNAKIEAYGGKAGTAFFQEREHFYAAINKSIAKYSLPTPDQTMLIRWGKNADDLRDDWQKKAASIIFLMGIVSFFVILAISLSAHCYVKFQRGREKKDHDSYHQHRKNTARKSPGTGSSVYAASNNSQASLPPTSTADVDRRRTS